LPKIDLMPRKKLLITPLLFIFYYAAFSQSSDTTPSLKSGSIANQFEYIYQNSNDFQEYKVVKKSSLDQLKSNMLDSITTMRREVSNITSILAGKNDSISNLNSFLEITEGDKQKAIDAKDNFNFLGMGIQKSVYSTMMWVIISGLAAALGFFSFQYSRSFIKIRKVQKDLVDVQGEFENLRKNTLDRERKLKRALIDAQMGKNS